MIRMKTILLGITVLSASLFTSTEAQAGPLLDWLRGRRNTSNVQQPAYNYYGNQAPVAPVANVAPNAYGLQPGQCMKTCQKTCSRTVVNYVPYTAYRTSWKRVPVTTYRPVTNSDPCTGCTVTCMRPCTSYTYQMQRVPYTTQRPVYRTETYKVPVTTITNDCATGGCSTGCDTCGTSGVGYQGAPLQGFAPSATPTPAQGSGSLSFPQTPTFETPQFPSEPANFAPSLSSGSTSRLQAPSNTLSTAGRYNTVGRSYDRTSQRPRVSIPRNLQKVTTRTAAVSPVQRDWDYSPVGLASFQQTPASATASVKAVRATAAPVRDREVNSFWQDVK